MENPEDNSPHAHSDPWPSEWIARNKAMRFAGAEMVSILRFIEARGMLGFTPNMYCEIVNGHEERIMAVRRRFMDLRDKGLARYHPDGLTILNQRGNPVNAWVIGKSPNAGTSKYKLAIEEANQLRLENVALKDTISKLQLTLEKFRGQLPL